MFKKRKNEKLVEEFGLALARLDWLDFIGIAHILCLALKDEEGQPREFYDLFCAMMDRYETIGIPQKKELLDLVKNARKANKKSGDN